MVDVGLKVRSLKVHVNTLPTMEVTLKTLPHSLGSAGQVDGHPSPVLVLGGGVDGALGVARTADGRGHALGRDEGPVAPAVGGELQPHAVGEGRGLAAAHADLKLQEGGAGHLEVPALRVPGLLCRGEGGRGGDKGEELCSNSLWVFVTPWSVVASQWRPS